MSRLKAILIILGLTIFFFIDELMLVLLGREIQIWYIRRSSLLAISAVALALNVLVAIVVHRAMKQKPTTGQEGMIGEQGVVISSIGKAGKISVHGEIWQAESDEVLHQGEKVIVQNVEGLKLLVRRNVD